MKARQPKRIPIVAEQDFFNAKTKCSYCPGSICCTYVTQHIPAPRSRKDFEHLLWQVSHEHIKAYKDEEGWTLLIESRCSHLQIDGGCGIYSMRPEICREHSNDYCEFDAPADEGFELYFPDYDSLREYCIRKFRSWDK